MTMGKGSPSRWLSAAPAWRLGTKMRALAALGEPLRGPLGLGAH